MSDETRTIEDVPRGKLEAPPPAEETLREELEASRKKGEELLTRMKYLQAEFDNFRKRTSRESEALGKNAHGALVAPLPPVLDGLGGALGSLDGDAGAGVRMVRDNFWRALEEVGVQEIPVGGRPFDPFLMDCGERVPDADRKDGDVKELVRRGDRLHDRVLRPAQVIVVRNGGDSNA